MVGRLPRSLVGVLAGSALLCGALTGPTTALPAASGPTSAGSSGNRAVSRTLVLDPGTPVVGERPRLSGRAPAPARRQVKLQVHRSDGTWRTIDRRRTRTDRTFGFRLDPVRASSVRLRVLAPAADKAGTWRSARATVQGVLQQVDLAVPTEATAGVPVITTATVTPPRPGRAVHLLLGEALVAAGTQDALGQAVLTLTAPPPGVTTVRATVPATEGAGSATSPPAALRTLAAVTGIPRVDIVTDDGQPITSKTTYKRATLSVDPRDSGVPAYSESTRLRVRGNFTSTALQKLPYRLKLDDSEELVGLPTSKDWVLLANFYDRSLLRTTLGMETGRRLGLPWSPRFVDVEVYLNGELKGLYQLGEGIEVDDDRVDIDLADETAPAPDGGYLLEADAYDDEDPRFVTTRGLQVYIKDPGAEDAFVDSVAAHVEDFENALYSPGFADPVNGYASRIDVDSFVDWYLVMELLKTVDAGMYNSVHLQRDQGGRLSMGPVWDFDISGGNRMRWQGTSPEGWYVRHNWYGQDSWVPSQLDGPEGHWWYQMFQDPVFEARVKARWREVRAGLMALPSYLDTRRVLMADAAERTFAPVEDGGAGMPQGPTPSDDGLLVHHETWAASADYLDGWLTARLQWMDAQLS